MVDTPLAGVLALNRVDLCPAGDSKDTCESAVVAPDPLLSMGEHKETNNDGI